jgi:hypothetical protein
VKIEDSYASSNHYLANVEFLRDLSEGKFVIYHMSEEDDIKYEAAKWTIFVRSIKTKDFVTRGIWESTEGIENYIGHNNIAMLSACHLILTGQKQVGVKAIELLSQISPNFGYHSPKRRPLHISEIKEAAIKYANGDESKETIIRALEQQYQFRASDYRWVLSEELRGTLRFGETIFVP